MNGFIATAISMGVFALVMLIFVINLESEDCKKHGGIVLLISIFFALLALFICLGLNTC